MKNLITFSAKLSTLSLTAKSDGGTLYSPRAFDVLGTRNFHGYRQATLIPTTTSGQPSLAALFFYRKLILETQQAPVSVRIRHGELHIVFQHSKSYHQQSRWFISLRPQGAIIASKPPAIAWRPLNLRAKFEQTLWHHWHYIYE